MATTPDRPASWEGIDRIPDQTYWSVRQLLKSHLLYLVRDRARAAPAQPGLTGPPDRLLKLADPSRPNVLTIGFARRFATYKRAALLFHDPEVLRSIICDADRPVLFLFAGRLTRPTIPVRRSSGASRRWRPARVRRPHPAAGGYDLHLAAPGGRVDAAQQPHLSGSLRHLGHESRHERCHQPVGAGWLVGRG
jgi:starch phosphorylase